MGVRLFGPEFIALLESVAHACVRVDREGFPSMMFGDLIGAVTSNARSSPPITRLEFTRQAVSEGDNWSPARIGRWRKPSSLESTTGVAVSVGSPLIEQPTPAGVMYKIVETDRTLTFFLEHAIDFSKLADAPGPRRPFWRTASSPAPHEP